DDIVKDGRSGLIGGAVHVVADDDRAMPVALQGFTIAGKDRRFVRATAEIRDGTVVVHSPQVAEPIAVRYGWADYPTGNLFNVEGLPAGPFRSDDWPPTLDKPQSMAESKTSASRPGTGRPLPETSP
ncbi:MAG TPA: hypothetical protein VFI31_23735, partial [Pirellulales bacterium]|nr:hypothetical protein [Pirellulales bacterium]